MPIDPYILQATSASIVPPRRKRDNQLCIVVVLVVALGHASLMSVIAVFCSIACDSIGSSVLSHTTITFSTSIGKVRDHARTRMPQDWEGVVFALVNRRATNSAVPGEAVEGHDRWSAALHGWGAVVARISVASLAAIRDALVAAVAISLSL